MPKRHNTLQLLLYLGLGVFGTWMLYPQDEAQEPQQQQEPAEQQEDSPEQQEELQPGEEDEPEEATDAEQTDEDAVETQQEAQQPTGEEEQEEPETPQAEQAEVQAFEEPTEQQQEEAAEAKQADEDATEEQQETQQPIGEEQAETQATEKMAESPQEATSEVIGQEYRGEVAQAEMQEEREEDAYEELPQEQEIVKLERPKPSRKRRERYMEFNFEEKPLTEIVHEFAKKQGLNIVLPHGEEAIKQTVTFKHDGKVSVSQAEPYIHLFLDLAGYKMYPHGSYYIVAKKPEKQENQMRNPATLYVNVPPHELPQSQEEIQAIYSLANLKIPEKEGGNEPISQLLKNTLSNQKAYLYDPQSNSIIMNDSAWNIASAMHILLSLDMTDSPEIMQSVQLYNSSAQTVAKLLNEQIIAKAQDNGKEPRQLSTQHFVSNVHVVPDTRRNRLIMLGRQEPVYKLQHFVQDYIDAQQDSGRSILHVYELQYLDAKEFAEVLKKLVQPVGAKGQQAEKKEGTGPTQHFEDVKIIAEPEQKAEAEVAQEGTQQKQKLSIGGNRLVIAARNDDWQRLRRIIADLDKPQKQVIIEVMIADVSASNLKQLGSQTRNPNIVDLPQDITFQASHLNSVPVLNQDQNSLVGDLLRLLAPDNQSIAQSLINTGTSPSESGAMLLSISDPYDANKIWSIFKVLDKYIESNVLSHPFLVTRDKVQAQAKNINIRRDTGELAEGASQSVSPTTKIQDFEAKLIVNVTPHVSSLDRLNMQIDIDIQDFIGESLNKNTRKVSTNANMQTGQVLVLGGLSRTIENTSKRETPFLSKLPVVGQFFKSNTKSYNRTNLVIFLTPTIVEPKLRQGLHRYTDDKIQQRYDEAQGAVFDNLSQPITRFFFNGMEDEANPLDDYLDEVQYKQQQKRKLRDAFIYEPQQEIMKSIPSYEDNSQLDTSALQEKLQDEDNPLAG